MKVLITGGSGYLGSRLVKHFFDNGASVIAISRNKKLLNYLPDFKPHNLFLWGSDSEMLNHLEGVDTVIHSAGMNYQDCLKDPYAAYEFNGAMTHKLLKLSTYSKVNKFIYISTSHVYGGNLEGEISEHLIPDPNNPYSSSHLEGESSIIENHSSSTTGIIVRLSNTFGQPIHQNIKCWDLLINQLALEAIQKNTITLNTNGLQKRDFVAIREVSNAIYYLSNLDSRKISNPIFNIGSQVTRSVLDTAKIIQDRCMLITGSRPKLIVSEDSYVNLNKEFLYKTENLNSIGYYIRDFFIEEIDSLLNFVKSNQYLSQTHKIIL